MKKVFLLITIIFCANILLAQNSSNVMQSEVGYNNLSQSQLRIENDVKRMDKQVKDFSLKLNSLSKENGVLRAKVDSLQDECKELNNKQISAKAELDDKIKQTNDSLDSNQNALENRTLGGIVVVIIIIIISASVAIYFLKRIKRGNESIDEIGKVQNALQQAQTKLQEESVALDNKMIELMDKQMAILPPSKSSSEIDHSLALKVADEIVHIEINLSRMDATIKGYKQLSKAVERIKNNFIANGYEIVEMLGKPYNEGMKVVANFVPDETLADGEQKITGIIKPQVNYNGKMIQAAQITVSQNI